MMRHRRTHFWSSRLPKLLLAVFLLTVVLLLSRLPFGRTAGHVMVVNPTQPNHKSGGGKVGQDRPVAANNHKPLGKPDSGPVHVPDEGQGGNGDNGLPPEAPVDSTPLRFTISMSSKMQNAWKTSSDRLTFSTKVGGLGSDTMDGSATFYGKSSLKIKYTKRRSIHIVLDSPVEVVPGSGVKVKSFVLLSLWEDTYRLAYRTSARILQQFGLFHPINRLVELRCEEGNSVCPTGTLGAYMLIEYPLDAIIRQAADDAALAADGKLPRRMCESAEAHKAREAAVAKTVNGVTEVGTRNWFYFVKPPVYDLLHVPSYKRNSTLSESYRKVEQDPGRFAQPGALSFGLQGYMAWLAINTALQNGDYDDEVFVYGSGVGGKGKQLHMQIMAWDYDNVFSKCHRNGKNAIRSKIMFCAETPLERNILKDSALTKMYTETLSCVLSKMPAMWDTAMDATVAELEAIMGSDAAVKAATFDDKKVPPNVAAGAKELKQSLNSRAHELQGGLPAHDSADSSTSSKSEGSRRSNSKKKKHSGDSGGEASGDSASSSGAGKCPSSKEVEARALVSKVVDGVIPYEIKGSGVTKFKKLWDAKDFTVRGFSFQMPDGTEVEDVQKEQKLGATPGLHCLAFRARVPFRDGSACELDIQRPAVLRSSERGKAEFAVTHFDKPSLAKFFSPSKEVPLPEDVQIQIITPSLWFRGPVFPSMFPVIVRVVDAKGNWIRENLFAQFNDGPPKMYDHAEGEARHHDFGRFGVDIVRGFSAFWLLHQMPYRDFKDVGDKLEGFSETTEFGPYFIKHSMAEEANKLDIVFQKKFRTAIRIPPRFDPSDALVELKEQMALGESYDLQQPKEGQEGEQPPPCSLMVKAQLQIDKGGSMTIAAGCTLMFTFGSGILVRGGGSFNTKGTAENPVLLLPYDENQSNQYGPFPQESPRFTKNKIRWSGIVAQAAETMVDMQYTFVIGTGAGRTDPATGKHHKKAAAVTVTNKATANIRDCFFLDLLGPAFASGTRGIVNVDNSLVQWAEMGIECVDCDFSSTGSTWTNFPSWTTADYVDEDNDAMYLSGGTHRVSHTVIAHTKDDGIDTGTPENFEGDGGSLMVDRTLIEMVAHEGIALSSSVKGKRNVKVDHSVIRYTQQGIEAGYSGPEHVATVDHVLITDSKVGVRYGDNYRKDVSGPLSVSQTTLWRNEVDALNYVRNKKGPTSDSKFKLTSMHMQSTPLFTSGPRCSAFYPKPSADSETTHATLTSKTADEMTKKLLGEYQLKREE